MVAGGQDDTHSVLRLEMVAGPLGSPSVVDHHVTPGYRGRLGLGRLQRPPLLLPPRHELNLVVDQQLWVGRDSHGRQVARDIHDHRDVHLDTYSHHMDNLVENQVGENIEHLRNRLVGNPDALDKVACEDGQDTVQV